MPMTLIQGYFDVIQASPDGDSIRFYPNNPDLWQKLPRRVRINNLGGGQLRIDSIDSLEMHYCPQGSRFSQQHQPLELANAAADELLKFLGFEKVTRNLDGVVTETEPKKVAGFILTQSTDNYGRSISFVFKGESDGIDGSDAFLNTTLIKQTVNYHLLAEGLAYPTFYRKLFPSLRKELFAAVQQARSENKGIWKLDKTNEGFCLDNLETLTHQVVILPKLFRRISNYLAINNGQSNLKGFLDFVKSQNEKAIVLPENKVMGLDTMIEVDGQNIKLTKAPEYLLFF